MNEFKGDLEAVRDSLVTVYRSTNRKMLAAQKRNLETPNSDDREEALKFEGALIGLKKAISIVDERRSSNTLGLADTQEEAVSKTSAVWEAYSAAYKARYKIFPESNAMVRSQMSSFINRVGKTDAPKIVEHYLKHNHRLYVDKAHPFGLCLADSTKLRTEWLNGTQVTSKEAVRTEGTQSNLNAFIGLMRETEAKEAQS